MTYATRRATLDDVDAICDIGLSDPAFAMSDRIAFYERAELVEWINSPRDNLLLVAQHNQGVVGFLFCKVMSYHWAMLDNFYVHPDHRHGQCSRQLLKAILAELRLKQVAYLSTLVAHDHAVLGRNLVRRGFARTRELDWYELFLPQDR